MGAQIDMIRTPSGNIVNFIPNIAVVVVPAVATTLPKGLLYVGVDGDVIARPAGQTGWVTFKGLAAGSILPVYITGVSEAAGTTATDMLMLY